MPLKNLLLSGQPTVLVVDDQPANLHLVGDLLTGSLSCEVIVASNGAQALRRMAARVPDLILMDMLMPGLSGLETCQRIKENPEWRDIPVIFLSASDDKILIVRALETGGVDYVTKPFSSAELLSRVRTHLALKAARDQLKALVEDKDEMLGMMTHDLKNHLGGMQMSAQLIHDRAGDLPDDRSRRLVDNILQSTTQMLAFLKEFLANSAAERPAQLWLGPVDVGDAVTLALRQYHLPAERKKLRLLWQPPAPPVVALAESLALHQVLENLLSNAVKFSPRERTITLTVTSDAEFASISIADEGPGFTAADHGKMFRRYARLSALSTANEPSSGLGLSIVKKLVADMHGKLTLESVPGHGAAFTIRLPLPTA